MNPPPEPEGKSPVAPSPTYESSSHAPTFSRGTKRDFSYEQLSQIPILTPGKEFEIQQDELILHSSMEDILGGDTGKFTPSYNELKKFMLKVLHVVIINSEIQMWHSLYGSRPRYMYYGLSYIG
jgi:hypothetical protein